MPDRITGVELESGGPIHTADVVENRGKWKPVRTVAVTTAGAGIGVIGAIAGITATAVVLELALPVTLCVWAGGITCGAIGLALGIKNKSRNRNTERRKHASKG